MNARGYRLEATARPEEADGGEFTWCEMRDCFRSPHREHEPHITYREAVACPNCGSILDVHTDLCPTSQMTYAAGEGYAVLVKFFTPYPRTVPFGTAYPRKFADV